jgi:ADP-heptose:LPS heptosyltransferase
MKILAMKFKFLGDIALMTPSLRALRNKYPQAELHVLVPEEAAAIVRHLPWIDKVWTVQRKRGKWQLLETWPLIAKLRREKFDRSVDFAGNDRGAIMSLAVGARERLAYKGSRGFLGRSRCYHKMVPRRQKLLYEAWYDLLVLHEGWGIRLPREIRVELAANPELDKPAAELLADNCVLCHISSVQPKKQWPLDCWHDFYVRAKKKGLRVVFSAGNSERERQELKSLGEMDEGIECLPQTRDLELFLAVLQRAQVFVSGDTGPLHFAVGLNVPTVSLFGASLAQSWAPQGDRHRVLQGKKCRCALASKACTNDAACMRGIKPERVLEMVGQLWR